MKAAVLTQYGSPDNFQITEVPMPSPADDEVLIKVQSTAVNDWEIGFLTGEPLFLRLLYGIRKPKVQILGTEVAGRVEKTGGKVKKFQVGEEVYGDLSESGFGGFAEYVCANENALISKPAGMTFQEAVTIPHAAMLALQGLIDKGGIQSDQKILINGAGGGVGTFGVQLAKTFNAEVTGVDTFEKFDMMKTLGFDHVIDYTQDDFTKSGKKYDLILDAKTNRSPFRYANVLEPNGTYVTVGGSLTRLFQLLILSPFISLFQKKKLSVLGLKPNKDLAHMNEMFESGNLKFAIDGPYQLNEVPMAVTLFQEGRHKGKVVINVQ